MRVEIEINPNINETTVLVKAKQNSSELQDLIQKIQDSNFNNSKLVVSKDEKTYILDFNEIESVYSKQGKVYVRKDNNEYITKNKLYELEKELLANCKSFIRISYSEIINFDKVESMDLGLTGTIEIRTKSGYTTYVSRRNIQKIKKYLNI